jgi:hypothetical protein
MDPQATLDRLLTGLALQNRDEVRAAADDLRAWLNGGGFPPLTIGSGSLGATWHSTIAAFVCDLAASRSLDAQAGFQPTGGR